jgi:hypothetical protein
MRPKIVSTARVPVSVSSNSSGTEPSSARFGYCSQRAAFSVVPSVSAAIATTRANLTILSLSTTVMRAESASRRLSVRSDIPIRRATWQDRKRSTATLPGNPHRGWSLSNLRSLCARHPAFSGPSHTRACPAAGAGAWMIAAAPRTGSPICAPFLANVSWRRLPAVSA